mgnify:CR=1 FL=1|tara:strand:- start:460 stop:867 length:408 start_codon:yes stop_codon:yes gene_type:complete
MSCLDCSKRELDGRYTQSSKELRKAWGCDEDAPNALMRITCPKCKGQVSDCPSCEGSGVKYLKRCPNAVALPDVSNALPYLALAQEGGPLPEKGGLLDQTSAFRKALLIYGEEIGKVREYIQENARNSSASNKIK